MTDPKVWTSLGKSLKFKFAFLKLEPNHVPDFMFVSTFYFKSKQKAHLRFLSWKQKNMLICITTPSVNVFSSKVKIELIQKSCFLPFRKIRFQQYKNKLLLTLKNLHKLRNVISRNMRTRVTPTCPHFIFQHPHSLRAIVLNMDSDCNFQKYNFKLVKSQQSVRQN